MSNNSISTYYFKPFEYQVLKKNVNTYEQPLERNKHRIVSNNAYLFLYGGGNAQMDHTIGPYIIPYMRELWKYCFDLGEWRKIPCKNVPEELICSSVSLSVNIMLIYGGTAVPYGASCSNHIYLGNLSNEFTDDGMKFEKLQVTGDVPNKLYGQAIVTYDKYVYLLGGTSSHQYEMDVHRLDLSTKKWELLYKSRGEYLEPENRFRSEVVFYKSKMYVFGAERRDPSSFYYGFQKIHLFDVITKKWQFKPAKPDVRVPQPGYPSSRNYHSCIQCPENPNLVYLSGGYNGIQIFRDVWRFDIDNLQWENLTYCVMPQAVYSHSTTVTPLGRMCTFGGIVSTVFIDNVCTNDIVSTWITIPKLKVIAWEAMIYYFKDQMFASTDDDLKKSGIPKEYYNRIIEERRIH